MSSDYENLIEDALYFRRVPEGRADLVWNVAALELQDQSAEVLPAVEQAIQTEIIPAFTDGTQDSLVGLSGLLGAYLFLGSKHAPDRVINFIKQLPTAL